jgi:hypothetical protein
MFTGRTAELQLLEKAYASDKTESAVIYARRRIVKSDERFQIDLIYNRIGKIVVVCEIKFSVNEIPTTVIPEIQRKCACAVNVAYQQYKEFIHQIAQKQGEFAIFTC